MATSVKEESGRVIINYDKKRGKNYFVIEEPPGQVIFESDSADEAVQWTVDRYAYNFEIKFAYQPSKTIPK